MARRIGRAVVIASVVLAGACAPGLDSHQIQALRAYEERGLKVVQNDEMAATLLGLVPGGGSFYTGHVGYGIINLLWWPMSMGWDPVSGRNGAQVNNYHATMRYVVKLRNEDLDALDARLRSNMIDQVEYTLEREAIMREYSVR